MLVLFVIFLMIGVLSVPVGAEENPGWTFGNTRGPNGLSGNTVIRYTGTATEVEIPRIDGGWTVIMIGQNAFSDAETVRKVIVGDHIKAIIYGAFASCESLEEVVLPKSIIIGAAAFSGCTNLKRINFPYEQNIIEHSTFKNSVKSDYYF